MQDDATLKFIKKATQVHGNLYDYRKTIYRSSHDYVDIICPKHGPFQKSATNHLQGWGCNECSKELKQKERAKKIQDKFIKDVTAKYKGKYIYDKVHLNTLNDYITVICPEHGEFTVKAIEHKNGSICKYCRNIEQRKLRYGVGIADIPCANKDKFYKIWNAMLARCYNPRCLELQPTYIDCNVCDEWLIFSNFKKWADDPNNGYIEGYDLDKDILVKGNRVYSPDTCCFVPHQLNTIFQKHRDKGLPVGVFKHPNGYKAVFNVNKSYTVLGVFETIDEASNAYKHAKESYIHKTVIDLYFKGKITKKVFDALVHYKID